MEILKPNVKQQLRQKLNLDLRQNISWSGFIGTLVVVSVLTLSCARAPVKDSTQVMRKTSFKEVSSGAEVDPKRFDDASFETLLEGLNAQIEYWQKKPAEQYINFGPKSLTAGEYLTALKSLKEKSVSKEAFFDYVVTHFDFYEVYGGDKWGEVMITGYYEPVIRGSRKPTKEFSQPLYKTPTDMVNVDMGAYARAFPHWKPFETFVTEQKSSPGLIRGRLVKSTGEPRPATVVPYYSRAEIDGQKPLSGQKLELAYVDPVESFFLQIQGSGQIEFKGGERLRVGYAAQNGHPYVPIGKFLKDVIPIEEMSLQRIETHLRTLSAQEQQSVLDYNPSYVFFTPLKGKALTYSGMEVVDGRTIATDWRHFPKGTLALLNFQKPVGNELIPTHRFVFDQDTGGAIRGTHRVDLFCGQGAEAKQMAGVMKHKGHLSYLVPKSAENTLK